MPYDIFTQKQEVTSTDIQNMASMTDEEYNTYIRENLIFVDHHDILKSQAAGYPLAVTKKQFKALMRYLKSLEARIGE